mmetsp:Transcript_82379/g.266793  ORF Transcript_82379/g.266793 Transcript_82379/m.266793 type:complete len:257 (+) Transcript_82379:1105-1875(+)
MATRSCALALQVLQSASNSDWTSSCSASNSSKSSCSSSTRLSAAICSALQESSSNRWPTTKSCVSRELSRCASWSSRSALAHTSANFAEQRRKPSNSCPMRRRSARNSCCEDSTSTVACSCSVAASMLNHPALNCSSKEISESSKSEASRFRSRICSCKILPSSLSDTKGAWSKSRCKFKDSARNSFKRYSNSSVALTSHRRCSALVLASSKTSAAKAFVTVPACCTEVSSLRRLCSLSKVRLRCDSISSACDRTL